MQTKANEIPLGPMTGWVLLCVLCAHVISLQSGFVDFDDPNIFLNRTDLQLGFIDTLKAAFDWHRPDTWRPIRDMSHWLDYALHGHTPFWSHVHNLLVLSLVVILCLRFFYEFGIRHRWLAVATIIAFTHPVQVETIAWVSGRKDLLAGVFFFGALIFSLRFIEGKSPLKNGLLISFCYVLGVLSKGHVIVLPAIIIALYWSIDVQQNRATCDKKSLGVIVISLGLIGLALVGRIADGGVSMPVEMADDPRYSLTWQDRIQIPLRYLGHLLYPTDLNHIYLVVLNETHTVFTWLSIPFIIGVIFATFKGFSSSDSRVFFVVTAIILVLPYLHFRPGVVYMADRYLFLIVPFLSVGAFSFFMSTERLMKCSERLFRILSMTAICACCVLSFGQHQAWQNSVLLWSRMADVYPTHPWAYDRLGHALYNEGRISEAIGSWIAAADRTDEPTEYLRKSALSTFELGLFQWSDALWTEILRRDPNDRQAKYYQDLRTHKKRQEDLKKLRNHRSSTKEDEKRVDDAPELSE